MSSSRPLPVQDASVPQTTRRERIIRAREAAAREKAGGKAGVPVDEAMAFFDRVVDEVYGED